MPSLTARLVHEDQLLWLDLPHRPPEPAALLPHVGPVALGGVQALLLAGQAEAVEGEPQGLQATPEAAPPPQLLQRGVGLLANQAGEPPQVARPENRGRAAPVRPGGERPGGAAPLEQANDEGGADAEDAGDPADRALVMIDRRRDPLPKI